MIKGLYIKDSKRQLIVDYMKAVCIIFVVCNHSGLFDKKAPLFLFSIDKAVPIFMMLSGYVIARTASGERIKEFYLPEKLWRKFVRLTIPTCITFGIYVALNFIRREEAITFVWIMKRFLLGDYGQGAYYYALMIELLLISPLIFWMVKEWEVHGLILIGLFNLLYDIFSSTYGLPTAVYRVLIFRYLLIIALGMYTGLKKEVKDWLLGLMLIVGVMYIVMPLYWGYDYRIFAYEPWDRTSMIAAFYVFPVIYILLKHLAELKISNQMIGGVYLS